MADLHWVNRAYMEMWADMSRPLKGSFKDSPYVWKYDFATGKIKNKDPKKIANKPANYYLLENTKGEAVHNHLEQQLGKIEGEFLSIIRKKISAQAPLDDNERLVIATFISLAVNRKPKQIERFTGFVNDILNEWVMPSLAKQIRNKNYSDAELESLRAGYKKETGLDISIEEMREGCKNIDHSHVSVELTKNRKLMTAFGVNIDRWAKFIMKHHWLFLRGEHFITGDLNSFAFFPLTPNVCMTLMIDEPGINWVELPENELKEVNIKIFNSCDTFSIAKNREILDELKIKKQIYEKREAEH
jgi:hypothetical protein